MRKAAVFKFYSKRYIYTVAQKLLDKRRLRFKERSVEGIFFTIVCIHYSALKGQNKSGDSQLLVSFPADHTKIKHE
jgi:hypothetical protein